MSFSHDDVQRLIKLLDSSHFDELHLEAEGIKLTLRRNGAPSPAVSMSPAVAAPMAPTTAPPAPTKASAPVAAPMPANDSTLIEIRAPMLGTFYGAPKPGADPFIAIGARVTANSAVGIIEVMKLMNSISAGVEGVLVEVLVRDGELVEFDQVLMRVRPV
ncbi:MAG: acetyl-CoA carboxylase biotin carboxyl carrier protein [Hydrogenophaga sp.]|nr:acetyl-CoA carboxylase biotin carboxyl carrier protein [Hydrogenophaga sp.]